MLLLYFVGKFIKKRSTMTYHRPLLIGNVLKVRLSCVKPSEKNRGKKSTKNSRQGEKNQDRGRIYTPETKCRTIDYVMYTLMTSCALVSSCNSNDVITFQWRSKGLQWRKKAFHAFGENILKVMFILFFFHFFILRNPKNLYKTYVQIIYVDRMGVALGLFSFSWSSNLLDRYVGV